jgi:hypothetical protein
MSRTSQELFLALRELWTYFAHWRIGKLLDNLAIWAKGPDCIGIEATSDEELLGAAQQQIAKRVAAGVSPQALSLEQDRTLMTFERFALRSESTVATTATLCSRLLSKRVYDIEDGEIRDAVASQKIPA